MPGAWQEDAENPEKSKHYFKIASMERLIMVFVLGSIGLTTAKSKGFNLWAWIIPSLGFLGLVVILFLPSSNGEMDEMKHEKRRRMGNKVGIGLSILIPIFVIAGYILLAYLQA
jgi:hypothetical protein